MTTTGAITATVICYALLGVLLLSLNFTSLWRWWVKAAAIALTVVACIGSYFSISGLLGWPAGGAMPERFNLLATRIVEPGIVKGDIGHIYLWVEEIDQDQIIISPPRAYEVPFVVELAFEVEKAQEVLDTGGSIMGEFDAEQAEAASGDNASRQNENVDQLATGNDGGNATGEGTRFDGTSPTASLTFSDMPPVPLPTKPPIQ
ncbi:MAG: hypothetical protein WBA73_19450 [Devosia sp.]